MENQIQNKKLEILVIEDDQNFINVAKNTYMNDTNINPKFASTYEEAIQYLNDLKIDGVVSDLFFPSKIDWKNEFLGEFKEELDRVISYFYNKCSSEEEKQRMKKEYIDHNVKNFEDFKNLDENPSGLGIMQYCNKNKIPYVIASQGERHRGKLGIVRRAVQYMKSFKKSKDDDPLARVLIEALPKSSFEYNIETDKGNKETWIDALYRNKRGLIDKIRVPEQDEIKVEKKYS